MNDPVSHPDEAQASGSSVAELAEAFRGVGRALKRRRREFVTIFLTVAIVVQIASFLWPGTYVARAAILIQRNRMSGGLSPDAERSPTVVSSGVSEQEVNSEIAVLTSREVLEATLQSTGLDKAEPSIWLRLLFGPLWAYEDFYAWYHGVPKPTRGDRALRGLESNLSVEPLKDSNVLVVSYESSNPTVAQGVLHQLVEHYLTRHVQVHHSAGAEAFFEEQAGGLKAELKTQEDLLQGVKREVGVSDLNVERETQQKILASLREEQDRLRRTVAELDQRAASYQAFLRREPTQVNTTLEGRNDYALQALNAEKLKLEIERVRLEERYRDDSPLLAENARKLEAANEAIARVTTGVSQKQTGLSPAAISASQDMERTRAEKAGYDERISQLNGQITSASERLGVVDEKLLDARRIERLISTSESQYMQYLRRGVEARIDSALDQGQFTNASVLQAAAAEPKPIKPKKLIALLLSILGGLLAGVAMVIVLELRESGLEAFLGSVAPRADVVR